MAARVEAVLITLSVEEEEVVELELPGVRVELVTLAKVATLIYKGRLMATLLAPSWVVVGRKAVRLAEHQLAGLP